MPCSSNVYTATQAAEHASVVELASLESFLSNREEALEELSAIGMGGWAAMPSASENSTCFAICGSLVVVAERDKKRAQLKAPRTQLFLYRLPGERRISALLDMGRCANDEGSGSEAVEVEHAADSVARIPLCVGVVEGEVRHIHFTKARLGDFPECSLKVVSEEEVKAWNLVDS